VPSYLSSSGWQWFALEGAFVALVVTGMASVWSAVRRRVDGAPRSAGILAAESVFAVPFVLFPALLGLSAAGLHRPALVATQLALGAAGLRAAIRHRRAARYWPHRLRAAVDADPLLVLALGAVALFIAWNWAMPVPEGFNGHHHLVVSQIHEWWRSNTLELLPRGTVSYDRSVLAYPAHLGMTLAVFSVQGIDAIDVRPVFLFAGVIALMTLVAMRATCRELGAPAAGSAAFLLVAFSYSTAGDLTQITYDLFSPLLVSLFGYHAARLVAKGEPDPLGLAVVLAAAAAIRPPAFLLLAAICLLGAMVRPRAVKTLVGALPRPPVAIPVAAAVALPALLWFGLMWAHYGTPLFPHKRTALAALGDAGPSGPDASAGRGSTAPDVVEHVLPFHRDGAEGLVKDVFCGLSLSLLLTLSTVAALAAGLIAAGRGTAALRSLRGLVLVYVAAYVAVLYVFFLDFPDYAPFIAPLIAPLPAVAAVVLLRGRALRATAAAVVAVTFLAGVGYWAKNTWGHMSEAPISRNLRLLWPTWGTPADRIAARLDRSAPDIRRAVIDYERAYAALGPGERILYADHEPGALIPSLLDREYLGDARFLDDRQNEAVLRAPTRAALRARLAAARIRFVVRPGRAHPGDEGFLLYRLLTGYRGPEQVVPVERLLAVRASPPPP